MNRKMAERIVRWFKGKCQMFKDRKDRTGPYYILSPEERAAEMLDVLFNYPRKVISDSQLLKSRRTSKVGNTIRTIC